MRVVGTYPQSFNYEVTIEGMLDARMLVPTYDDLLLFNEENYLPKGFLVSVVDDDPEKAGLYRLVDNTDLSNPDSWKNISSSASNGLTKVDKDIKLGGTLSEETTITLNSNVLKIIGDNNNGLQLHSNDVSDGIRDGYIGPSGFSTFLDHPDLGHYISSFNTFGIQFGNNLGQNFNITPPLIGYRDYVSISSRAANPIIFTGPSHVQSTITPTNPTDLVRLTDLTAYVKKLGGNTILGTQIFDGDTYFTSSSDVYGGKVRITGQNNDSASTLIELNANSANGLAHILFKATISGGSPTQMSLRYYPEDYSSSGIGGTNHFYVFGSGITIGQSVNGGQALAYISDIATYVANYVPLSSANIADGYAKLDGNALLPLSLFPDAVLGNAKYKGTYNGTIVSSADVALNGNPLPAASSSNVGYYFISTDTFTESGITYDTGDWIISNGSAGWKKVDNSDAVTTVFGRLGNILANEADYEAFYPKLSSTYSNPTWINTLAFSKLIGTPTTKVGYGITDVVDTYSDQGINGFKTFNYNLAARALSMYDIGATLDAGQLSSAAVFIGSTLSDRDRTVRLYTGSVQDWAIGENSGKDFLLRRYVSGSLVDYPFIVNTTTGNMGIGALYTSSRLTVSNQITTQSTALAGTVVHISNTNSEITRLLVDSYGTSSYSILTFRKARGTSVSPTALQSGDSIGFLSSQGYGATTYGSNSRQFLGVWATENYTDTASGTEIRLYTTPNTTIIPVERMKIGNDGFISFGLNYTGSQANRFTFTEDNTSSTIGVFSVQNKSVTGFSSHDFYDNTGALKAAIGYANASATAVLAGTNYFYSASASTPWVFNMASVEKIRITNTTTSINGTSPLAGTYTNSLYVKNTLAAGGSLAIQNTNALGYSDIHYYNDANVFKLSMGVPSSGVSSYGTASAFFNTHDGGYMFFGVNGNEKVRISTGGLGAFQSNIGTTSTTGVGILNPQAATAAAPIQYSPRLRFGGNAWNTTSSGSNNAVDAIIELRPISATSPGANIFYSFAFASGSYSDIAALSKDGNWALSGRLSVQSTLPHSIPAALSIGTLDFTTSANYSVAGFGIQFQGTKYTSTSSSGTIGLVGVHTIASPLLAANSATTLTDVATQYWAGAPTVSGANMTFTRSWATWVNSGNSFFGGNLYIGLVASPAVPTARLHIAAGTATAGTGPLKLTAGTNLTIVENGVFEYDGTNLYFSTGGVRKTVTLV